MRESATRFDQKSTQGSKDPIIAVTMATSRQGSAVVRHLSNQGIYKIRAITRDIESARSLKLSELQNVTLIKGDLLNKKSLSKAFEGVYGIFGNTSPTKSFGMDINYEMKQGLNLINVIREIRQAGHLKHLVFSSVCKGKNTLPSIKVPGHFKTKWTLEKHIDRCGLSKLTTILRPASYFENFNSKLPGIKITNQFFPGIVSPDCPWQTIAVDDIGLWASTAFKYPKRFLGESLNLAGEELTGNQMAGLLDSIQKTKEKKVKYLMIPRFVLNIIEDDIAIMANWIENIGYGADIALLKKLTKELNINPTSLHNWLHTNAINKDRREDDLLTISNNEFNLSTENTA